MAVYHRAHSLWWSAAIPDSSMLSTLCCSALYYGGSRERVPGQWNFSPFLFLVVPGVAFLFRRACVFPASVGSASSVGADHWPLTFPQQSSVTPNQLPYIPRYSTVRHAPGRCHACYRLVWSMAIEEERRPPASPASGIASWPLWGLTFCRHPACLWPRARLQWMVAARLLCCCASPPPPPPPFFFLSLIHV